MAFTYIDKNGTPQQVELNPDELLGMVKTGNPVAEINKKFSDFKPEYGTAFAQFSASVGLSRTDSQNVFGLRSAKIGDVLDGKAGFNAANVAQNASPFGTASRAFVNIAIINEVTSELQKDRTTDSNTFEGMIANTISVDTEHFEQPVIDYKNRGGSEEVKASRVVQGAAPPRILFFGTSDKIRRIPAWNIGMEWSDQALRNTTLDYVSMTLQHYLQIERDERVYAYINELWNGNGDSIIGAVTPVTSVSLDSASTGGVLTHKAWVKALARNRKYRRITHAICTIDTYLKVENRTGRPGSNNYDPTLARIDPQAQVQNNTWGNDVKFFIVDAVADGGPVADGTILFVDASVAISRVTNTAASYAATEEFAMKRTSAMRMDWAEMMFRSFGDTDLRAFDALVITP